MTEKIYFVIDDGKLRITAPENLKGQSLPSGFVSAYEHDYEPRGVAGWVKVPTSLLAHGNITLVGIKEESWEEQQLREAREEFHRAGGRVFGKTSGPSQEWVDQPEGFRLTADPAEVPLMPDQVKPLEALADHDDGELFEEIEPEETQTLVLTDSIHDTIRQPALIGYDAWDDPYVTEAGLLHRLGFVPRPNTDGSVHRWYHPMFGDDRPDNWLLFDLESDRWDTIAVKAFRMGARLGSRQLKLQVKAALENH